MDKADKIINYNFYHWGPFLYQTILQPEELMKIKKLCSKKTKDYRKNLAGLIRHEHLVDSKKLFPIISSYFYSYCQARHQHYNVGKPINNKVKLVTSWVNYMTKFESNPMHTHDNDLSFVIFTKIPKQLKEENKKAISNTKPGCINFVYSLGDKKQDISQHTFFPREGDFFIFPANLSHYVNHFTSEGERISISGNLDVS
jgi:hypothetical protein